MEPLPKQGCELSCGITLKKRDVVSVEPLPKQGCEAAAVDMWWPGRGLSGTPAEAGVRECDSRNRDKLKERLSGTPAEAGVRVGPCLTGSMPTLVSVEPLPKQGCEH